MSEFAQANKLAGSLLAVVLKSNVDEVVIANKGIFEPSVILEKVKINERLKRRIHSSVYHDLDPFQKMVEELNEVKLQQDINIIQTTWLKTISQLLTGYYFAYLESSVNLAKERNEEENTLLKNYKEHNRSYDNIKKKISKRMSNAEMQMHIADEIIETLKNDLDSYKRVNALEMTLVSKWEQTRFDQAEILNENDENILKRQNEVYSAKKSNEERIIQDIKNYNELQINRFQEKITFWREKYEKELNELINQIKCTTESATNIRKRREKHVIVYEHRQQVINDYRELKARQQKEFEFQQRRINSAIKIQAWWRGVMVRRNLGPYRKKKKGKKGKKGK